jgi:tetratricopeptide (TPR) repeat protein
MFATVFQILRSASLTLLLASLSCSALAQGTTPPGAQVRDHLQRAQAALRANDAAAAEKEFRAVLALDPKNPDAHAGIGVLDIGHGDYQAASAQFRSALAAQPSFTKALALLGICQKRLGDSSARASLETSFQKLQEKPLRVHVGMELSGLYEQQGDMEAAASLMRQLVQLDPENPDILFAAQRMYSDLAEDTLNKLAVVAPGSARMQQAIAEKLINVGDLNGAMDHYRKALQIDPRVSGVHYELGEAILESARTNGAAQAEAQKELEAAIAVDGETAKTECELADIALLQSAPDRALVHYQRAYRLNPNEVQAQMGLATLAMQENPQEAIKYLHMAVQSDPLNASAHYQLARAYQHLQMTELAEKELHLSQEIKTTKDQVEALYHQMHRYIKPETPEARDKDIPEQKP